MSLRTPKGFFTYLLPKTNALKNHGLLILALVSFISFPALSQKKRCITEEKMQEVFQNDPQAKIRYENSRRMLDQKVRQYLSGGNDLLLRTNAIISIPVAVHIMTPNPSLITNDIVQAQIDTLNFFYGGAPEGDSLRVYTPFRSVYGRSQIRFCLAQRTPGNSATNGIERLTTTTTYSGSVHPSTEVPAWNTQNYLNIWVVNMGSSGILGYSYKPGTFPVGDQKIGFVVDYRAFGSGGSYLYPDYSKGRTAVHEIGHYFNLDHTWGPNNSGNSTCALDDGCSDTPPTNGPFFGCPDQVTGIPILNSCSPNAPGIMWQNHMDYANDACMNLFTAQQATRMETALNNAPDRNTLISSNGCQPVVISPNDAGIYKIISPANGSISCSPTVAPLVTLRNYGTSPLTSVIISVTLNGVLQPAQSWIGLISPNSSIDVPLTGINLNPGLNTFSVATSMPNGVADGDSGNDAATSKTTYATTGSLPLIEGFETTSFPPSNWSLVNPNGDFTWTRTTPGRSSSNSIFINNYDVDATNSIDDFRSMPVSSSGVTTLNIDFDVAHKYYGTSGMFWDTLSVLVSNDCGATYQTVYKKWGPTLATAGSSATAYTSPVTSDWRSESISVTGATLSGSELLVVFRNTSRYGNNIFIDNINIQKQSQRDLKLVSINYPGAFACSNQISPQITVQNNGAEEISSFRVGYSINNGLVQDQNFTQTLIPGATTTITLPVSAITPGNQTIRIFTADPVSVSGTGDFQKNNDSATRAFTVVNLLNPPVVEGFEISLPASGWSLINPNGNATWIKKTPGRNSAWSAFIDNYNNQNADQTDDIKTPFINVNGADSLVMRFDLAHKNYPSVGNSDTLTVLVSNDCGNSYTSVYKKWGATLSTAGTSEDDYVAPAFQDWRPERISMGNVITANGSVNILIRNTNRYGNNIFLDNINIEPVFKRDARIVSINQPAAILCDGNVSPSVTVKNAGMEIITGLKITYSIDNGAVQTKNLTGLNLDRESSIDVSLTPVGVTGTGSHRIRVYSSEPVTASGIGDQYKSNDTLSKSFSLAGTVSAPLIEDFSAGFVPANWSVVNPDDGITWNQYVTGNGNPGSAFVNTYNYPVQGQKDDLASPNIIFSGVDSVTLSFDLSAATYSYSGSTNVPMDTLEVLISKDCGNSFTTVYKKWGADLQTISDPNNTQVNEFFPGFNSWRKEIIDLTGMGDHGPVMIFFRTTNNWENNIFIDNVNLTTRILPQRIKQQGYLILPNPFRTSFGVWHVQTPTTLKYIQVYNSVGQKVYNRVYNGNALKMEMVDLSSQAAGTYIVKLGYEDESRNVSEKVVKY